MTFRERRNFVEMTRALGCPEVVSLEDLRKPNFLKVARLIKWCVLKFDPEPEGVTMDIETEQDRVLFIKSVAEMMASKNRVKLNTRRLYAADGRAFKELLKLVSVLYEAVVREAIASVEQSSANPTADATTDGSVPLSSLARSFDAARSLRTKNVRLAASSLVTTGANLYDMLKAEPQYRSQRQQALARELDLNQMQTALTDACETMERLCDEYQQQARGEFDDEATLSEKLDKKLKELERMQQRWTTIQKVRPAHMDEVEDMETQLRALYAEYCSKYCNMVYMERRLEEFQHGTHGAGNNRGDAAAAGVLNSASVRRPGEIREFSEVELNNTMDVFHIGNDNNNEATDVSDDDDDGGMGADLDTGGESDAEPSAKKASVAGRPANASHPPRQYSGKSQPQKRMVAASNDRSMPPRPTSRAGERRSVPPRPSAAPASDSEPDSNSQPRVKPALSSMPNRRAGSSSNQLLDDADRAHSSPDTAPELRSRRKPNNTTAVDQSNAQRRHPTAAGGRNVTTASESDASADENALANDESQLFGDDKTFNPDAGKNSKTNVFDLDEDF